MRRTHLTALCVVVTASASALAGCRSGETADGADTPPSTTTEATADAARSDAGEAALTSAIGSLRSVNEGRFRMSLGSESGYTLWSEAGQYRIEPVGVHFLRQVQESDGLYTVEMLESGRESWMRISKPDERPGCWMHGTLDGAEIPGGVDPATVELEVPAAAGVPLSATDGELDGSVIVGQADLATTAAGLGNEMAARLGVSMAAHARLPIRFDVQGGKVTGWKATIEELADAAEDGGLEPDHELASSGITLHAGLSDAKSPYDFSPPPPDRVVELASPDFAAEMQACAG